MIFNFKSSMGIARICIIVLILGAFTRCVSHKNLLKLQDGATKDSMIVTHQKPLYLIKPGDILDIKVSSHDPQSVAIFNKTIGNPTAGSLVNDASFYLNGYIVSDSGFVVLPLIGNVLIKDLSLKEAKTKIEDQMAPYFKYFSVDVKLISFRVTVLGEVNHQGTFNLYNENANILQVIGMAGGLTDLADNKRVRVIRNERARSVLAYLDIGSSKVISSDYYYLQPNDVIYVEPLKAKPFRVNATATQVLLSAFTFVVVVLNFVVR